MTTQIIRMLAVLVWLCGFAAIPATAANDPSNVNLQVDLRRPGGPVPYAYRAGSDS